MAAFLAAHPEHAEALGSFLDAEAALRRPTSEMETLAPAAREPPIGDYELLDGIARGGMGVVFRARQASVGRVVALKLMLSGEAPRFKADSTRHGAMDGPLQSWSHLLLPWAATAAAALATASASPR